MTVPPPPFFQAQTVDKRLRAVLLTVEAWKQLRRVIALLDRLRSVDGDCALGAIEAVDHAIAVERPIATSLRAVSGATAGKQQATQGYPVSHSPRLILNIRNTCDKGHVHAPSLLLSLLNASMFAFPPSSPPPVPFRSPYPLQS